MTITPKTIAILGGTGAEGTGLAIRWAHYGHKIIIASRSEDRAGAAAEYINEQLGIDSVRGARTEAAAEMAEIVVLSVPYSAQMATAKEVAALLKGKILIDVTVPLVPPQVTKVQLPPTMSCVVALQEMLGAEVRVVSAFQNVSAHMLKDIEHELDCDVLVASDDKAARKEVIELADNAGLRAIDAGPLINSVVAESLTSILIWINRTYKIHHAGIRITGLPEAR